MTHQETGVTAVMAAAGAFTRLDHVGIAVWDASRVIPYYRDTLGLPLVGDELVAEPGTRLVYFALGDSFVQLVAPASDDAPIREWLTEHGEGLHHICLAADDLATAAERSEDPTGVKVFRAGRRRNACFMNGVAPHSVLIEVTENHPSR